MCLPRLDEILNSTTRMLELVVLETAVVVPRDHPEIVSTTPTGVFVPRSSPGSYRVLNPALVRCLMFKQTTEKINNRFIPDGV